MLQSLVIHQKTNYLCWNIPLARYKEQDEEENDEAIGGFLRKMPPPLPQDIC